MSIGPARRGERETAFDWLVAALAVALAGIHVYLGVTADRPQFLVVGGLFVLGVVFFFTRYWRAVLYLLAAVYVATLGVLWVLGGMAYRNVGVVTGAISVVFLGLSVYLYVRKSSEESESGEESG